MTNLLAALSTTPGKTPACHEHPAIFNNADLFYDDATAAEDRVPTEDRIRLAQARVDAENAAVDVCMGCPLMLACEEQAIAMALANEPVAGVVGGRTEDEIQDIVAIKRGRTRTKIQHVNPQIALGDRGPRNQVDDTAVERLTIAGRNAEYIARELNCSTRTVVRARGRIAKAKAATAAAPTETTTAATPVAEPRNLTGVDTTTAEQALLVNQVTTQVQQATRPARRPVTAINTTSTARAAHPHRPTRTPAAAATGCTGGSTLNTRSVTPAMTVIYDLLLDGAWHHRDTLVAAATHTIDADEALANWVRRNSTPGPTGRVIKPSKENTPTAERIAAGARDKVYNMLSASERNGKHTEKDGAMFRLTDAARTVWAAARQAQQAVSA